MDFVSINVIYLLVFINGCVLLLYLNSLTYQYQNIFY